MNAGHADRVPRAEVEDSFDRCSGTSDSMPAWRTAAVTSAGLSRDHGSAASHGSETCTQDGRNTIAIGIRSDSTSAAVQRQCRQAADCLVMRKAIKPMAATRRLVFNAMA